MIKLFCDICDKPTTDPALLNQQTGEAFCQTCASWAEEFSKGKQDIIKADLKRQQAHVAQYRADFYKKKTDTKLKAV